MYLLIFNKGIVYCAIYCYLHQALDTHVFSVAPPPVLATWYIRSETRDFEKRSPKEKRGGNDKREKEFLLGERRGVAVRECSRPYLRGSRH